MKKHKTLYSRSSTGAIYEWFIEQKDNKYRISTGQIDGKKVIHEYLECFGKNIGKANETSDIEQCELEIKAEYKKKLKSGYFEDIKSIDNETFFEPMLAKSFKDYEDKIDWKEVLVQQKYNGGRIIARKTGLFSRKGEKILSVPHIEEGLVGFFEKYPNAVLDGEGFNYDLREQLNKIMSLLRKTVHILSEDLEESKKLIRYYVYDGFLEPADKKLGYKGRKEKLDSVLKSFYGSGEIIRFVPTWQANNKKELDKLYNEFLDDKQEGAIIRIDNKPYENKRSKYLLKYKPVDDAEFTITGISKGKADWSELAKIIHLIDDKGKEFDATFKGTMEEALECINNKKKWIGKKVTIYYNGLTGLGTPNYAQFDYCNSIKS